MKINRTPFEIGQFHEKPVELRTNFNVEIVDGGVEREEPPGNHKSNHKSNHNNNTGLVEAKASELHLM